MIDMLLFLQGKTGKLGSRIADLFEGELSKTLPADVAIDVSVPDALEGLLSACLETDTPLVIGTTGHSKSQIELLHASAKTLPILIAPNFSLGISWLKKILSQTDNLSINQVDIVETHHTEKLDKPSGTALSLSQTLREHTIEINSLRIPDEIGEHEVILSMNDERITIKHKALSRDLFARGAIAAAKFLAVQKPGLYSMEDL